MDTEQRALFATAVEAATAKVSGAMLDAALDDIGWRDALDVDAQTAVSVLFEAQGQSNATSSALEAVLAHAGATGVVARDPSGMDPHMKLVECAGPPDAVAAGQRALAHELIGASRAMLELARVHALERIQFDVPIASFQAVRHRLAEALVAIEAADGAVAASWEDGTPFAASIAKAIAGRSARTVARHSQQVLAGIGFTAEHPFHRYFRRTRVLDHLLGDSRTLTRELGEYLLSARTLPPVLPL